MFDEQLLREEILSVGPIYSTKQMNDLKLKNNNLAPESAFISISVGKCIQEVLPEGQTCAEGEELKNYFADLALYFFEQ